MNLSRDVRSLILGCAIVAFLLFITRSDSKTWSSNLEQSLASTFSSEPSEKIGYVTWLGKTGDGSDKQDNYFLATRILVYQILHAPATRSPRGLPIIVMTTPDVTAENRQRLVDDGATVIPIDFVTEGADWLTPRRPTWVHLMSKLRAWELTDYSRLLLLDGDMLLRRPLDPIFDEANATFTNTLPEGQGQHYPNFAPMPSQYLLAAAPEVNGAKHHWPPSRANNDFIHPTEFNMGMAMLGPSIEMFNYYISMLKHKNSFGSGKMEQALLNFAHRPGGMMPWRDLPSTYNIRSPLEEDIMGNVASIHDKWWHKPASYPALGTWYAAMREEMEAFYAARDAAAAGEGEAK